MPYLLQRIFLVFITCLVFNVSYGKITRNGTVYYTHKEIASKLKLKSHWNPQNEEATLIGPDIRLSFLNKKRFININNIKVWLGMPIFLNKNELYISETDFQKAIAPILVPQNYSMPPKLSTIVIDAGHGGNDEGARNYDYNLKEKDLALDLSLDLKHELEQLGYKVILTRDKDKFLALQDRPEIANNTGADLFISIHFNSVETDKESVRGIETYILSLQNHPSTSSHTVTDLEKELLAGNKNDVWNSLIGYNLQNNLITHLNAQDRGLKRSRFAVLRTLNCPGVLVEAGFLSNSNECKKINSLDYKQKIVNSLVAGIKEYHKTLNRIQ